MNLLKWESVLTDVCHDQPFVEMFLPSKDWLSLKKLLDDASDEVVYFAGNAAGDFDATDKDSVNPVTWGAFKGKE